MTSDQKTKNFLRELKERLSKEMPRVKREIKVYERNLALGRLKSNPKVFSHFNG